MTDSEFFEYAIELPDEKLTAVAKGLVGFEERYTRLEKDLRLISDPVGLRDWAKRQYGAIPPIVEIATDRYPLFILIGDVGTGKTEFAKAAGNRLVQNLRRQGALFALSTRVRGEGRVGEASSRINAAFDTVVAGLGKAKICVLLIDEADSLVTSRGEEHSHLEDKVAVNTVIQKVDDLRRHGGRLVVFLATNRVHAIDAAIIRRAAGIEVFNRPSDSERRELFVKDLAGLGLQTGTLDELVAITGAKNGRPGFTYSDIRTRLLPRILTAAFPTRKIADADALDAAKQTEPSPVVA